MPKETRRRPILVVDQEAPAAIIALRLRLKGFFAEPVSSLGELGRKLAQSSLVLLDVDLAGPGLPDQARRLKRRGIPCVLMTSRGNCPLDAMPKPLNYDRLGGMILALLQRAAAAAATAARGK